MESFHEVSNVSPAQEVLLDSWKMAQRAPFWAMTTPFCSIFRTEAESRRERRRRQASRPEFEGRILGFYNGCLVLERVFGQDYWGYQKKWWLNTTSAPLNGWFLMAQPEAGFLG